MNTPSYNIERLLASVSDIAETKIELAKLRVASKISVSLSSFIAIMMAVLLSVTAIIIISFGVAYFIGNRLNNLSYGFFIVGGFHVLVCLLIYVNRRKWLQDPLSNLFIKKIINGEGY